MRPAWLLWLLLPSLTIARGTTHNSDHKNPSRSSQNGLRRLRPSPYGRRRIALDSMEKEQIGKLEAAQKSNMVVTDGDTRHQNNSRAHSSVDHSRRPLGPPLYGLHPFAVKNNEKKEPLIFNATQKNTRILSDLYTGFLNNTFPVPLYLKSSTLVNSLSGLTTFGLRPTLLLGGAALLGASGELSKLFILLYYVFLLPFPLFPPSFLIPSPLSNSIAVTYLHG